MWTMFFKGLMKACFLLAAWQAMAAPASQEALRTVERVDLQRYMGVWHEIARYPNRFQRQCAGASTATYRLQADGTVEVLNRCRTQQGQWDQALGQARQLGGPESARLQVRFAPAWLSFLPMVWGDYWIVALDEAYEWVIVSEPRREFLWVLSRTPTLSVPQNELVMARLVQLGFDTARLERSVP